MAVHSVEYRHFESERFEIVGRECFRHQSPVFVAGSGRKTCPKTIQKVTLGRGNFHRMQTKDGTSKRKSLPTRFWRSYICLKAETEGFQASRRSPKTVFSNEQKHKNGRDAIHFWCNTKMGVSENVHLSTVFFADPASLHATSQERYTQFRRVRELFQVSQSG